MPVFYNYTEGGYVYSFDDVFVPADAFRQGNLWSWGYNAYGQLGDFRTVDRSTPVTTLAGGANWKQVASGGRSSAAIKTDGTLWTWGSNYRGELGDNTMINRSTPVTTFAGGTNWKQVSCGGNFTSAIKTDGTLWVWGQNSYGQLGINLGLSTNSRTTPVTTFAGGTNWKQVSCAYACMAAIKTDGTLWTWGRNSEGQLGINNTTTPICTPVTTFAGGTNWKQVSTSNGNSHTAAIKTDGTLWTWGRNNNGQLGDNTTITRTTPVTTFAGGTNWKQVSAGDGATAAVKTDGTLWLWGGNYGTLGTNNNPNRSTPVTTFAGGTNWKQVSSGIGVIEAIKTDGTLWVWGSSGAGGVMGVNDTNFRLTPVTTFAGGTNWKKVSVGRNQTSAIKTDGTLWIWGFGSQAGIGDNTAVTKLTPVTTFAGGTNWNQIYSGGGHTLAVTYIDSYM